jgi:FKBP-type peptidyl-prolyl cis-trans isomerase 2
MVKNNDVVYVNYTGKFEDGKIFDTSNGREPLVVELGKNQVIKGFEEGLIGMSIGEKKTVSIPMQDGYGERYEYMVQEVPKEKVPEDVKLGDNLQAPTPAGTINFVVVDIKEETVTLDANHPLAGYNLVFDLELLDIVAN